MKKLFVCALAASMFTACSQDETISQQSPMQISFDGAFVNNATRAAQDPGFHNDNKPIEAFDVWAFMDNTNGIVFNNEDVTKVGSNWAYTNTALWFANKDYYFAALAPMNSKNVTIELAQGDKAENGLGNIKFTNINGTEDLLYATHKRTTPAEILEQPTAVKFDFNHMLAKVKFTFTNAFTSANYKIKVTNLTMDVNNLAQIDLAGDKVWKTHSGKLTLDFGTIAEFGIGATEECAYERLTIPTDATKDYTVNITAELYIGDVPAKTIEKTALIQGMALEMGKAYNFTAEFNASNFVGDDEPASQLFPITFDAQVIDWVDAEIGILGVGGEIKSNYTMITDASASSKVDLAEGVEYDGAGHTLSISGEPQEFYESRTLRLIQTNGDATIKNLTIDGENVSYTFDGDNDGEVDNYGIRGIFLTGEGETVIDNVTFKNVTYTLNDDTSVKTLKVINSVMEGWTSFNPQTTATFEGCSFMPGPNSNGFRPIGNTIVKNCSFADGFKIYLNKMTANNKTIKFVNCTYNGNLITAENVGTIITDAGEGVIVW